jgi:hypothetical protein
MVFYRSAGISNFSSRPRPLTSEELFLVQLTVRTSVEAGVRNPIAFFGKVPRCFDAGLVDASSHAGVIT